VTRPRWFSTVRNQTTFVAAGVVGVALVVAAIGLVWLVEARLVAAERSAAALRADDVMALARTGNLPKRLSYPGEETGATQVVGASGAVIASTSNIEGEPPIQTTRPGPGKANSAIRSGLPIGDGQRYVVVAQTEKVSNGAVTVLAAASLHSADDTVSALVLALGLGLSGLILGVGLTTRVLVGRALRPVAAITREVAEITHGDLHRRVPEPETSDEIDRLAATMNEMLSRLEASSDRQRRFIADASHELRSPLASARAVLEVARLHPGTRTQLIDAVDDALIDHGRLDKLVLDLLALARLDDPRATISTQLVDAVEVVRELVHRRSDSAIEMSFVGDTPVRIDSSLLERLLTNLLDNAERHRSTRTSVTLSVLHSSVELVVEDDGPGIAAVHRERVFQPFTRLDDAREADHGTGLGLAIVREIALALGGSVRLDEGDMGGARVSVQIPTGSAR